MNCTSCGRANRPSARFCDACGAALAAPSGDSGIARKVVTIVFADLIGSTSLHERLDAESVRRVMDRYYRALRDVVDAHGGRVVKLLGDGVMAAFGVPRVREDDAVRAVRAAVGMQDAVRMLVREQRGVLDGVGLRVAVNTGEVVVSEDNTDVVGDPVNVAARLQEGASDGDVLIGESTRRLVGELVTLAPAGPLVLKGRSESVAAHRVVSLERPSGAAATPFVGRDEELRRLIAVYDVAVTARAARLAVVLGSPGLGKSRLVAEVVRRVGDDATVLTAHCDAAGGPTFAPLVDAFRRLLGLDAAADPEIVRIAIGAVLPPGIVEQPRLVDGMVALLTGTPAAPDETFFVVRRFLAALAVIRPVLLAIDDLQWGESLLLDLTEHFVQWTGDAAVMVLVAARPELRDMRPSLATPRGCAHDVVTLGGLDAAAATRLAASVIGADALPAAVAGRVLATSEGNPLFVGELVRMLVQDGALKREGDRWTAGVELAELEMPPTIHALLAARLERLDAADRAVLERAAVVGRQFSRAAVAALLPVETRGGLDARLDGLRRSELIEHDAGWFLGEPALRFHHVLIRDAAYRRILKGTRAELHGQLAEWLEARVGSTVEHDETIGWHLEQAHQHLRELGPLDARGRAVGARAVRHLAAAGRRALARDELAVAASLLGRALERLDPDDPARAELALDSCEALLAAGNVTAGAVAVDELGRHAGTSARLGAWHTCFVGQLAALTNPQALRTTMDGVASAADTLAALDDAAGEAKAHSVHALALVRLGKVGACEAALDRALAAARRAGDRRRANTVLAGAPVAALWGPSPVMRASGRCLDVVRVLRITQGAPAVEAVALRCQAVLEALRGRADAAQRMIAASRQMVEELGITHRVLEVDVFAGLIELLQDDAVGAERRLRSAYEGLKAQGLGVDAAQAAALLGRALLALDRGAEAEALSHESEALAGDDLKAASAWRGVRAEALARRGQATAAVDCARAAVEIAAATDALLDHADARLALAVALRAAGRSEDADLEAARAIDLWETKGATLLADRARGQGASAAEPSGQPRSLGVRWRDEQEGPAREGRSPSPFANTATRTFDEFMRCWQARDWEGVVAVCAPTALLVDRRSLTGVDVEGTDFLASLRVVFDMTFSRWQGDLLATRGDRLALYRWHAEADDPSTGPVVVEYLGVNEVDATGRAVVNLAFDADLLDEAYEALDARYAAGEGAPHAALLATNALFRRASAARDWDTVAGLLPADFTLTSHRRVVGSVAIGRDEYLATRGAVDDLGLEGDLRLDHVLRVSDTASVQVVTWFGTISGGLFEDSFVSFYLHDGERPHAIELYDLDQLDTALARYEALGKSAAKARFSNAAARAQVEDERRWRGRDWDGVVASFAPTFLLEDRRTLVGVDLGGEQFLANLGLLFSASRSRLESEVLATRGERLVLLHVRISGEAGEGGRFEEQHLAVVERGADGRVVGLVTFDLADVAAAYAELDRRYASGEGRAYADLIAQLQEFGRAEPDALLELFPADFTVLSHRRFASTETRLDRGAFVASLHAFDDLDVRVDVRVDHMPRLSSGAGVVVLSSRGTIQGGAFEHDMVVVHVHDGKRFRSWEVFDLDQTDRALARYDELTSTAAHHGIDTAATRWLETHATDHHHRVLGTRGERLVLARCGTEGPEDGATDPMARAPLAIFEVDESGVGRRGEVFDSADAAPAYAALDALFASGEGAVHAGVWAGMDAFARAFASRDWDRLTARLSPDLVVYDRRLIGWETLHGPGAYVQALRSLVELAPDVHLRLDHVTMTEYGYLVITTWVGTREGGAFETPSLMVAELDGAKRIRRFDQYDMDDLAAALARLTVVAARAPGDPLVIPPNAATRARDRWQRAVETNDRAALEALCAPEFLLDDRRRVASATLDRETYIRNATLIGAAVPSITRTLLATSGDRLALERTRWTASLDGSSVFDMEHLVVVEVDGQGRLLAVTSFDPDERRAAGAELAERYARGEGAAWMPARARDFFRGLRARDVARCRAALPEDFTFHDHRRTGPGKQEGLDSYGWWLTSLWEQSPDGMIETLYVVAAEPHGSVGMGRTYGTLPGGGPFEMLFARLMVVRGDDIAAIELFEPEDMERARARFEALRPAG